MMLRGPWTPVVEEIYVVRANTLRVCERRPVQARPLRFGGRSRESVTMKGASQKGTTVNSGSSIQFSYRCRQLSRQSDLLQDKSQIPPPHQLVSRLPPTGPHDHSLDYHDHRTQRADHGECSLASFRHLKGTGAAGGEHHRCETDGT